MDIRSSRLRLSTEHKEFIKDLTTLMVGYTPVSGAVGIITFGNKWFGQKRSLHRTVEYMVEYVKECNRKSYIKKRSRRIGEAHRKLGNKYHPNENMAIKNIVK